MLGATTRIALGCAMMMLAHFGVAADASDFAARSERAFRAAEQNARRDPASGDALILLSRAAFEWAEFARDGDRRAEIANRGIEAARSAVQQAETNAAAHYWLAMNLGQLARTKSLGALKLVREMETEFLRARALDPHVDYAGSDRSLGLLYRDAPGWPTSVGNKKKCRVHLDAAVQLHPEFPDNQLALAETLAEWADKPGLARQVQVTETTMTEARKRFTGSEWEPSWADWNKRLADVKQKTGSRPSSTPPKGSR